SSYTSKISLHGQLIDQEGRPVSQYPIKIQATGNQGVSSVAFTDFSGEFQFFNLVSGKYSVYPLSEKSSIQSREVELTAGQDLNLGVITLSRQIKVELNSEAARTINPEAAKTINPDAAQTLNPEAAKTINFEAARTINPEAAKTINVEAARTINPDA